MSKVAYVSIATGKYLDFWVAQIKSLCQNAAMGETINAHVFTDSTVEAELAVHGTSNLRLTTHKIPSLGWPDATLLRYEIFHLAKERISEDVIVYLDADMIVHKAVSAMIVKSASGMTFIRHPGFYRPKKLRLFALYLRNWKLALTDVSRLLRYGALGAWETRKQSNAQVTRSIRKTYYCGGVWWGDRESFFSFCEELHRRVQEDSRVGVVAKWHDESHLNWWASTKSHHESDPRWCYYVTYPWLSGLPNYVEAVDKLDWVRS